jgi:hypothetical protein
MSNKPLTKEFEYFKEHQEELIHKYEGRFIVIRNQKVVGDYESEIEAYNSAKEQFELGTFLIQQAVPGTDAYTQTFHSRVLAP